MPRRCTVCFHHARDEIDNRLSGGSVISRLASEYSVSQQALLRHKANHLLPEMREQLATDPHLRDVDVLAEMKGLYSRMKNHLHRAEEADNWQAIRAFHSEAVKDLELLAKLLGELDERPVLNLHVSPEWLELRAVIVGALEPYSEAQGAVLRAIEGAGNGEPIRGPQARPRPRGIRTDARVNPRPVAVRPPPVLRRPHPHKRIEAKRQEHHKRRGRAP